MSKVPSTALTYTPVTYSSGPSKIDYGQLFALFNVKAKDPESDDWAPYVEETLCQPQLDDVKFEFPYGDDPSDEWRSTAFWNNEEPQSWESLAKVLILCLDQATKCWLHPKSTTGYPALVEYHSGTVNRIAGDRLSVTYGTGDDQFEAEYALTDICSPEGISRGDRIEAVIGLWYQKHQARGIDHLVTQAEQQKLDADWDSEKNLVRGDLDL